jgi:hypothetical protein
VLSSPLHKLRHRWISDHRSNGALTQASSSRGTHTLLARQCIMNVLSFLAPFWVAWQAAPASGPCLHFPVPRPYCLGVCVPEVESLGGQKSRALTNGSRAFIRDPRELPSPSLPLTSTLFFGSGGSWPTSLSSSHLMKGSQ